MQPAIMSADQIQTAVKAAQQENLALVIDLPSGELTICDANALRAEGSLRHALGQAAVFDLSQATHIRAVKRHDPDETWFRLWP